VESTNDDLVELFDLAWTRLRDRLDGLTDAEWSWCPTPDDRISLRWRLSHIAGLLTEPRNWLWLNISPTPVDEPALPSSAAEALATTTDAFAAWRSLVARPDIDLSAPLGVVAGRYGESTRLSFILHIADELIHHAAEAALLRDLYAARRAAG
jgi:hypothetical protein